MFFTNVFRSFGRKDGQEFAAKKMESGRVGEGRRERGRNGLTGIDARKNNQQKSYRTLSRVCSCIDRVCTRQNPPWRYSVSKRMHARKKERSYESAHTKLSKKKKKKNESAHTLARTRAPSSGRQRSQSNLHGVVPIRDLLLHHRLRRALKRNLIGAGKRPSRPHTRRPQGTRRQKNGDDGGNSNYRIVHSSTYTTIRVMNLAAPTSGQPTDQAV